MIVTDRFVFVHMHKTGGQTINKIISQCIPDHRLIGYHYPIAEVPEEAAELPVVGIVRNPWDWYVSWYAFNRRPGMRNQLFHVVSEGGAADFKSTVTNLVQLGSAAPQHAAHRLELAELLPETIEGNRGAGLTRSCMQELAAADTGYLGWLIARMLGDDAGNSTCIGRFENLGDEFPAILERLGVAESESVRAALGNRKRENVSRHSHYSHYYDNELRDLIAEREHRLVEEFGYRFESRKPDGACYDFPGEARVAAEQGFRKLLGRGENFLRLNDRLDVSELRRKVEDIPAERWAESDRRKIFMVHRDTQSLELVHFEDYKHEQPEFRDLYSDFSEALDPVVDYIAGYYRDNGFVVRALLAKLAAGGEIPRHTDAGYSLMNSHRVHLPIITNDDVEFFVGGESTHMNPGELWEINNATEHGVRNAGKDDRVHLIVDWMPNYAGQSVADALAADDLDGEERAAANEAMLAPIISRGLKLQRSGQMDKAEALYRQVLHFNADHVIANNLLGLLCLQTRRFDEAVQLIGTALKSAPDDAQAHGNLGLALKETGRLEDAGRHLGESLRLAPDNPRVLSNLGSIYLLSGQAEPAANCFQEALRIQPGFVEVRFNLGNALLQLQRYEEAAANLQQCLALRPDLAGARQQLDKALALLEDAGAGQ